MRLHRRRRPRRSVAASRVRGPRLPGPRRRRRLRPPRARARLLSARPSEAERIDVGAAAPKPLDQDAISYLLAEKAREGKVVVRLKWGDPFVFDSGGKEADLPARAADSVRSGAGSARWRLPGPPTPGVPLTYPEAGDVVILMRGNEAETDEPPRVDWDARRRCSAARSSATPAPRQIGAIARALLSHGRPPRRRRCSSTTPTTPRRRRWRARSATSLTRALRRSARAAHRRRGRGAARAPALVRRPAALRPPHRRDPCARAGRRAGRRARGARRRGDRAADDPHPAAVEDPATLDAACDAAETFDWIVFTSVNGVDHFMRRFLSRRDIRDLKGVRDLRGRPRARQRRSRYGMRVDAHRRRISLRGDRAALAEIGAVGQARFLLPRAEIARELLVERAADGRRPTSRKSRPTRRSAAAKAARRTSTACCSSARSMR